MDVTNVFLHGELEEPVYMTQPWGFVDPERPNHLCRLSKALYRVKQALRVWFNTFSNFLIDFGFTCSKSNMSLFTLHSNDKTLILLLYVNDILLTGSDDALIQDLLRALHNIFSMKDLGKPHYFLGTEIESNYGSLFLHQKAYAEDIVYRAAMSYCNPMPTPLPQRIEDPSTKMFLNQPTSGALLENVST